MATQRKTGSSTTTSNKQAAAAPVLQRPSPLPPISQRPVPGPPPPPPPPPPSFQAATYVFSLDNIHIDVTRSAEDDTDTVTTALKVGDTIFGPQSKFLGDLGTGDHAVGLEFGPVVVYSPGTLVTFNYLIVNKAGDPSSLITQMEAAAVKLLGSYFSIPTSWQTIVGDILSYLVGFFEGWCDGPVAADQISLTGAQLWAMTNGVGTHTETRYYPGTGSNWGCGANSQYSITWSAIGAGVLSATYVNRLAEGLTLQA